MATGWDANEGQNVIENAQVSVDRDFARFGGKSYAINKINSVEVRERRPHGGGAMMLWGLLTFIFAITLLQSLKEPSSGTFWGVVLTALFGFLAYRAYLNTKLVEFQLFLMTSSSETEAITSRDGQMIDALRNRIESAMAGQLSS